MDVFLELDWHYGGKPILPQWSLAVLQVGLKTSFFRRSQYANQHFENCWLDCELIHGTQHTYIRIFSVFREGLALVFRGKTLGQSVPCSLLASQLWASLG